MVEGVHSVCMPPPRRIPDVNTRLSSFYIESNGIKLKLHPNAIEHPTDPMDTPLLVIKEGVCKGCEDPFCCKGWPALQPKNIIVLKVCDISAKTAYGWYARFEGEPFRLVRLPPSVCATLFLKCAGEAHLQSSLLYDRLNDISLFDDEFQFEELLIRKLKIMNTAASITRKRKRSKQEELPMERLSEESEERGQYRPPSIPASPRRNMEDCCSICLEEVEITPSRCCGISGGTCQKCNDKVRGLCTLCDRKVLTSTLRCSVCKKKRTFEESGFPCCGCGKGCVCVHCHAQMGICWDCLDIPGMM